MTIQEQLPDEAQAATAADAATPHLTCSNGTCSVPNLVTLAQADPLIPQTDPHPDMLSQMAFGCYNSAIVMVANAALANRRSGLAPAGGRTKEFDAISASVNGAGHAVPKAVNQLIWQYHRQIEDSAGTGRVYYLHEMVADFANGHILQSHDPKNYGSCWGPATNAAGAAFRDGLWDWAHVDDEYVRTLLADGVVPLLAFGRYTPVATWNAATSRYDVTLTKAPANQHKVVFSGYTAGAKYGLDIHDPGSGGTANVRLVRGGPELRGAVRGFGVAAATGALLGKLTWRNHDTAGGAVQTVPPPSGTFLEYEGTVNPTDPVLVLEHMDGASLSWKGGERVWSGRWGPWTHMTTFVKDGTDHLLTYNRPTGAVMISRFWGSLRGVETVWQGTWGPWTHFVPFTWNGNDHLLTYDRDSGTAMISRFWPGLNGVETVWQGTWGPWTHLAVFYRDGQPFLLTYDRASQKVMTSRFWGGLNGVDTIWEGQWGPWTHLVPMSAPDRTHLVAYDAATGVLQISQFFPGLTGTHATHQETIAPGCDIAAVRAPGLPHFTVHRHQIDRRTLYRISPDGVDPVAGLSTGGGTKGASIDVPFRLDGRAYQVNYYPATQDVDFTRWRTL